jgi:hypothetical protein
LISRDDRSFAIVLRWAGAAGAFDAPFWALAFGAWVWLAAGAATNAAARVTAAKAASVAKAAFLMASFFLRRGAVADDGVAGGRL